MRLIDAERLDVFAAKCPKGRDLYSFMDGVTAVLKEVDKLPVINLVRCKDCEYYVETNGRIGTCELTISGAKDDGFCAWGERKNDADN